jgi:peptide deformylase
MAVRALRLFPDPILSRACVRVSAGDAEIRELVEDLTDSLEISQGVGLAAPQIGVLKQVSVIDVRRLKRRPLPVNHGFMVLINPALLRGEGEQIPREGCLSVPDLLANVRRFHRVVVRTETLNGATVTIESEGFEALAFQHELDHLQGRLFLDRVANVRTDIFRRKNV